MFLIGGFWRENCGFPVGSDRWLAVVVGCRGVRVTSGCDPRNGWPVWLNPGRRENAACTLCMAIWVGEGNRVRWEAWFLGRRWKNNGCFYP